MIDTPQNMWLSCQKIFRSNVNEQQYQTWFSPMRFKSFDAEKKELLVGIPSQFFYEYLEEHFRRLLRLAINRVFGNGEDIDLVYEIEVVESATVKIESNAPQYSSSTQNKEEGINKSPQLAQAVGQPHDLDSQLNPSQNFKNFIEGASNKLPRSIGETIARNPEQQAFNPLFIYGHSGVGKTHLVNAIGTQIKELHPEKRVLYLSAHLFEIQFTDSRKNNTFSDFIHFYQSIDVLIMDDVQELIGKVKTQYAFFHIFNHLKQIGKQIILTSDRPPTALEGMEDRLITRFKSGLLAELEQPEEKLRRDILASKIKHDGLNAADDNAGGLHGRPGLETADIVERRRHGIRLVAEAEAAEIGRLKRHEEHRGETEHHEDAHIKFERTIFVHSEHPVDFVCSYTVVNIQAVIIKSRPSTIREEMTTVLVVALETPSGVGRAQ